MTIDLGPKSCRFLASAIREKIERMKAVRDAMHEDDQWETDNDIMLYEVLLREMEKAEFLKAQPT